MAIKTIHYIISRLLVPIKRACQIANDNNKEGVCDCFERIAIKDSSRFLFLSKRFSQSSIRDLAYVFDQKNYRIDEKLQTKLIEANDYRHRFYFGREGQNKIEKKMRRKVI